MGKRIVTTNSTSTTNDVRNTSMEDIAGIAIAADGGSQVYLSDQGAIAAGSDIAQAALSASEDTSAAALALGRTAVTSVTDLAGRVAGNAQEFATAALASNRTTFEDAIGALSDFAGKTAASTDSRVQDIAKQAIVGVLVSVALAFLLPGLMGKKA